MSMAMEELKKELAKKCLELGGAHEWGVLSATTKAAYLADADEFILIFLKWHNKPRCKEKECGEVLWGIEVSIGYCSTCQAVADHNDD